MIEIDDDFNPDPEVEEVYNDFWKGIVEKNGQVNMDQVKKELFDFYFLIDAIPKVYDAVTGGMISKPLTSPEMVISIFNDYVQDLCDEAVKEFAEAHGIKYDG